MRLDARVVRGATESMPRTPDHLWSWVALHTGVRLARAAVCRGHHAPFDALSTWFLGRPSMALCLGARGSGKSFMSGIDTHLDSRFRPRHSTRVLGGSEAQARQIYNAIDEAVAQGEGPPPFRLHDRASIRQLGKEITTYRNGSDVEILTASTKSARGPHVPALKLDEVDEIDPEIRDASMGMCMDKHGHRAKLVMTSTWHNLGGPMTELIEKATAEGWPFHRFCSFEVLERCPESRSGPYVGGQDLYANCPACPLMKWCHAERDSNGGRALAKMSDGHYGIDALAQKTAMVSARVFEADYLCRGPKADGIWFADFDRRLHVAEEAEFRPGLDVHFSIDTGVRTGAVWFQVDLAHDWRTGRREASVNVFADYYAEHLTPYQHVHGRREGSERDTEGILAEAARRCNGRMDRRWTDPAGKARNASGTVVVGEFLAAGLGLEPWPKVGIKDALALVESLLAAADGTVRLRIHPRCRHLISALEGYRRAKVRGTYVDWPEEPQHPAENLVDPLKNGLVAVIGIHGQAPSAVHRRADPRRIF